MSNLEVDIEIEEHHANYRTFDLTAGLKLLGFAADLYGWSVANPSGSTAAIMDLYDGDDTTGTPFATLKLASAGFDVKWFGPNGIRLNNSLYANVTAGEMKGSVFYRHIRR